MKRVGCLQFAPALGQVEENMRRADTILENTPDLAHSGLDWLILPEMAFTGYNFPSLEAITPFLEPTAAGRSAQWAQSTARRLGCHVTVGYPEIVQLPPGSELPRLRYNSTVTVAPNGTVILNYRKSFLYYTDETWASEGYWPTPESNRRFFSGPLGSLANVSMGICMDINPYKFTAPWDAYEFAHSVIAASSKVVCVSMAWLTRLTPEELMNKPEEPDMETLAYWVERFYPLKVARERDPVIVICANRAGSEGEVGYAGTSTVFMVNNGSVSIFDVCGKGEERCMIVDLTRGPKFALEQKQIS